VRINIVGKLNIFKNVSKIITNTTISFWIIPNNFQFFSLQLYQEFDSDIDELNEN